MPKYYLFVYRCFSYEIIMLINTAFIFFPFAFLVFVAPL